MVEYTGRAIVRNATPVIREAFVAAAHRWIETLGAENEDVDIRTWIAQNVGFDWVTKTAVVCTSLGVVILAGKYLLRTRN